MTWTGTAPSWYAELTPTVRSNIFYPGETPSFTISQATPDTYTVRDWYGNIISTGAPSISGSTLTVPEPTSYGWFRVYLTGPNSDAVYGNSYGAISFLRVPTSTIIPPRPATATTGYGIGGSEAQDPLLKGWMGMGWSRYQIGNAASPTSGVDSIATAQAGDVVYGVGYWSNPTYTNWADSVRPARQLVVQFPNLSVDRIAFTANGSDFLHLYPLNRSFTWGNFYATLSAGTSSGYKLTLAYPNSSTVVETYDNQANGNAMVAAVNASSTFVKAFTQNNGGTPNLAGPVNLGQAYRDGIVSVVSTLYPQGITVYEGPKNEPSLTNFGAEFAWAQKWFQDAVHAGNASAISLGPTPVQIDEWGAFLSSGGAAYCDALSFHAYNSVTNGDLNLGRTQIQKFLDLLASFSITLDLWVTESTNVFNSVYGVHHPRRSRIMPLTTLLWEQYGVPRERNLVWYDNQHGFWGYPAQTTNNASRGPMPYVGLYRTLGEQTHRMNYDSKFDFGCDAANAIFLGSLYSGPDASCAVFLTASHIDNSTITLGVTGATSLTVVDGWGNSSSLSAAGGICQIPVSELPTYVQLPTGVSVTVKSVLDWPEGQGDSISVHATTHTVGGIDAPAIADNQYLSQYGPQVGVYLSPNALPEDAILLFPNLQWVRGIVAHGQAWQNDSALVDFDVDVTTNGGTTWTTVATVTKPTPSSFNHGTSSNDARCIQETYWDEQYVFPVSFPRQQVNGIRLHVRATSYGGEPDAAAIAAGGQGNAAQYITLQEISVLPSTVTYTYQWQRAGVNIAGATSSTYSTVQADSGHAIGCVVTASTDGGSTSASSNTISLTAPPQVVGIPILP